MQVCILISFNTQLSCVTLNIAVFVCLFCFLALSAFSHIGYTTGVCILYARNMTICTYFLPLVIHTCAKFQKSKAKLVWEVTLGRLIGLPNWECSLYHTAVVGWKTTTSSDSRTCWKKFFLYSKNSRHDYINLELFHEKLILFLCSVEPCGLNGYKWSRKHIWILWSLQCQEVPTVILCIFSSTLGKMDNGLSTHYMYRSCSTMETHSVKLPVHSFSADNNAKGDLAQEELCS